MWAPHGVPPPDDFKQTADGRYALDAASAGPIVRLARPSCPTSHLGNPSAHVDVHCMLEGVNTWLRAWHEGLIVRRRTTRSDSTFSTFAASGHAVAGQFVICTPQTSPRTSPARTISEVASGNEVSGDAVGPNPPFGGRFWHENPSNTTLRTFWGLVCKIPGRTQQTFYGITV